ncbi:MAG: hypothetical protein IPP91_15965 [Betaproteobacteria bacterium]|nr:hypothetical protein [Betaproteobacteria bacterium]
MAMTTNDRFSSKAAPEALGEALNDCMDGQQTDSPRRHVMGSFAASLEEFGSVYRELAK